MRDIISNDLWVSGPHERALAIGSNHKSGYLASIPLAGVLALAIAASIDPIVSGDRDLFDLESLQNIAIVTPARALLRIEA